MCVDGWSRKEGGPASLVVNFVIFISDVSTSTLPSIHIYTTYPIACVNSLDDGFLPLGLDKLNSSAHY